MIEIKEFFRKLKESIESHATELKQGELFLPKYLEGKSLTDGVFPKIIKTLASILNLEITHEYCNNMPPPIEYECGNRQIVDYVLNEDSNPHFFLELESLDRAQLYLFREHEAVTEERQR